jgi:hypothetical protein
MEVVDGSEGRRQSNGKWKREETTTMISIAIAIR